MQNDFLINPSYQAGTDNRSNQLNPNNFFLHLPKFLIFMIGSFRPIFNKLFSNFLFFLSKNPEVFNPSVKPAHSQKYEG